MLLKLIAAVLTCQFTVEVESVPAFSVSVEAPTVQQQLIVADPPKASRQYLAMFTASWCGPCQQWKRNVLPQVQAAGHHVMMIDMDAASSRVYRKKINRFPAFVVCDWETGKWLTEPEFGGIDLARAVRMLVGSDQEKPKRVVSAVSTGPKLAPPVRYIQPEVPGRYVVYDNTTYDMETWTRMCSLRNCGMCQYLDSMQAQYLANKAAMINPQASSSPEVVDEAIEIMQLTPSDVVAELGCGDGKAAIQMVKRSGCRVEGYEIDPQKVAEARRNVADAGLSHRITIHEKDVVGLRLPDSTTAVFAFLYKELLEKIRPQLMTGRIAVCPGHKVDGIGMQLIGQCWVRKSMMQ